MSLILKNPMWVVSKEGWEFATKDRNHVQYIENKIKYIIECEYCFPSEGVLTVIYFESIKSSDGIQPEEQEKEIIKNRIKAALEIMGGKYEIC